MALNSLLCADVPLRNYSLTSGSKENWRSCLMDRVTTRHAFATINGSVFLYKVITFSMFLCKDCIFSLNIISFASVTLFVILCLISSIVFSFSLGRHVCTCWSKSGLCCFQSYGSYYIVLTPETLKCASALRTDLNLFKSCSAETFCFNFSSVLSGIL